jgi:hypothetical protein
MALQLAIMIEGQEGLHLTGLFGDPTRPSLATAGRR